jgi:hypothetical protein
VQIGRRSETDSSYFNGTIDEVAIYNRSLSEAEIRQHYNARVVLLQRDAYLGKGGGVIYGDLDIVNSTGSSRFFVDVSSGNVGIGTTNPNSTLTVNGPIQLMANTTVVVCNSTYAGAIYYDGTQSKHYGCNGSAWNALY